MGICFSKQRKCFKMVNPIFYFLCNKLLFAWDGAKNCTKVFFSKTGNIYTSAIKDSFSLFDGIFVFLKSTKFYLN